jgi:hypothetical protein
MERNSKQLHRPACFSEAKAVLESCAALAEAMPDNFSVQVGIAAAPDGCADGAGRSDLVRPARGR